MFGGRTPPLMASGVRLVDKTTCMAIPVARTWIGTDNEATFKLYIRVRTHTNICIHIHRENVNAQWSPESIRQQNGQLTTINEGPSFSFIVRIIIIIVIINNIFRNVDMDIDQEKIGKRDRVPQCIAYAHFCLIVVFVGWMFRWWRIAYDTMRNDVCSCAKCTLKIGLVVAKIRKFTEWSNKTTMLWSEKNRFFHDLYAFSASHSFVSLQWLLLFFSSSSCHCIAFVHHWIKYIIAWCR